MYNVTYFDMKMYIQSSLTFQLMNISIIARSVFEPFLNCPSHLFLSLPCPHCLWGNPCHYIFAFPRILYIQMQTICILFKSDSFYSASLFWETAMLWCVSIVYSFLWLSSMPFYGYAIICLSIYLLVDIWIVSNFGCCK